MNVYFDNAATTQVCPEAAAAVLQTMTEDYGNPSSAHAPGRRAKSLLETSRRQVADALRVRPEELIFTSGGTEADNWAVLSGIRLMRHKGGHIITTATEHDAVRRCMDLLEAQGFSITRLKADRSGRVSPEDFESALRADTVLASVMLVNNETGAVNPVAELAGLLHQQNSAALFHTDACLLYTSLPLSFKAQIQRRSCPIAGKNGPAFFLRHSPALRLGGCRAHHIGLHHAVIQKLQMGACLRHLSLIHI